jgi:hypothetical protein
MNEEPDYYETLQVSPRAESDVVEAAYRRLARKYHPDINPDLAAVQRMQDLNRAFEILIDPRKRAEYDRRRLRALAQKAITEQPDVRLFSSYPEQNTSWQTRVAQPWLWILGGMAVVLLALGIALFDANTDSGFGFLTRGDTESPPSSPVPAVAGVSSAPTPSPTPPAQGSSTFSNGTWLVGEEIAPGMWRALRSRACAWKRLSSIEGTTDTVAAAGSLLTVEISPTDAAFWSEGCGWWTQILAPPSSTPTDPFGPGTWLVNQEVAPGLWQNSDSSEGCSWSRLSSLDGSPSSVNGVGFGFTVITIELTEADRAFDSKGCGTWSRVGP